MARVIQTLDNVRKSGKTTVSTTAVPVTKIGNTSSANTTYTDTTVTDGTAWDLSTVAAQDIIVTEDGYKGKITAVDDTNDILTVKAWLSPEGKSGTDVKPTDGQTATIHRIDHCTVFLVQATLGNTQALRLGLDGTARSDDYRVQPGVAVTLTPYQSRNIDITKVYLVSESGSQTIEWAVLTL